MNLQWPLLLLLLQLVTVDAAESYGFFRKFCAEYNRAIGPGVYSSYSSNVNDGETCVMKFNYHPRNNEAALVTCNQLSPFTTSKAVIIAEGMECTLKSFVTCASDEDMIIGDQCYTVLPPDQGDCANGLASIENSIEVKWLSIRYGVDHEVLEVGLESTAFHQPQNPDEPTKTHIALFLGAGNAGKLFYINDQQAAPYAKLCKPDIPIQAVGSLMNFCDQLKLFDVVTFYDTNACYVASGSYYRLDTFEKKSKRCSNLFGPLARDAPTNTEYDFIAANMMLKMLRAREGSFSSFGTRLTYENRDHYKKDLIHRNMDWDEDHHGNGNQLYQFENYPLVTTDRVSFHFATNNYSSLINQRPSKFVRQLCRIGEGADKFKPRDGVCPATDKVFVTDKGYIKCIAPSPTGYRELGNENACPQGYEQSSFESTREFEFFNSYASKEFELLNINAQYNYGQRENSYGRYVWRDGRQLIYSHFFDAYIDGSDLSTEACLHTGYLQKTTWNDNRCLVDLGKTVGYYCTRTVE